MTLEKANEIIEYFNQHTIQNMQGVKIEHIAPVPADDQDRANYMHQYWADKYDEKDFYNIRNNDLTVGVFYYDEDDPTIYRIALTEQWLIHYGIHNFPQEFIEILDQSLSSESE